jgi:hypothetical protein
VSIAPEPAAQQFPSRRKLVLEAFVVWAVLSTVYLLTLAGNYTEAEDSLHYLIAIRSGNPSEFDPIHLAFGWIGWSAYQVALIAGYDGGPLLPLQVLNALTGALGVALLWALLRMVAPSRVVAMAGCGTLAFSYGYWWYSVLADVYAPSALLLICSLFFAYHAAMRPSWRAFALLGVAHALAILVHLVNVLFVIVPVVTLLFAWRELSSMRDVMRCALAYASVIVGIAFLPYELTSPGIFSRSAGEIGYTWLTGSRGEVWGQWEATSIPEAIVGIGRALVGGHFALSVGPIRDFAADNLPAGRLLREELFLVRDFNPVLAVLLLVLVIALALTLLIHALRWLSHPALDGPARVLATLCLSWFVPYTLFFIWWEPLNIEFWIGPWVPLAILLALPFSKSDYARWRFLPGTVIVLIGGLFAVNLLGSVWPQHYPENDYWRVRSSWYERNTKSSDLVVVRNYTFFAYLRYFGQGTVVFIPETVSELERQINDSPAQRVLFTSEVFYPLSGEFSFRHCPNADLRRECENAAALRDAFLHRTYIVDNEPLEEIRELDRR